MYYKIVKNHTTNSVYLSFLAADEIPQLDDAVVDAQPVALLDGVVRRPLLAAWQLQHRRRAAAEPIDGHFLRQPVHQVDAVDGGPRGGGQQRRARRHRRLDGRDVDRGRRRRDRQDAGARLRLHQVGLQQQLATATGVSVLSTFTSSLW